MVAIESYPITIVRNRSIDNLRGLAIALMIVDHAILAFHGPMTIHNTVTRAAMPIFFLLSGHLIKRFSWRLVGIGLIGLILPTIVPFIDDPNVLFWYAVMAPLVLILKRYYFHGLYLILFIVFMLTANFHYFLLNGFTSYPPLVLLALMCFGAIIPRIELTSITWIPTIFSKVGSYPISIYVGHLLIIQGLLEITS